MRAIGHFLIFVGFFLMLALVLALIILSAATFRSWFLLLLVLPAGPLLYRIYAWGYRQARARVQ